MSHNRLYTFIIAAIAVASWFNLSAVALYIPNTSDSDTVISAVNDYPINTDDTSLSDMTDTLDPNYKIPPAQSVEPFFHSNQDLSEDLRSFIDASNYHLIRQSLPNPALNYTQAVRRDLSNPKSHSVLDYPNGTNIYVIYFGTGFPSYCDPNYGGVCLSIQQMFASFFNNAPNNPWFDTLLQYYGVDSSSIIHPRMNYLKYIVDTSNKTGITRGFIESYLRSAIHNTFGADPHGVYVFMAGNSVGWHSRTIGFHTSFYDGRQIPYIFVSDAQPSITLGHEVAETLTDPLINGFSWNSAGGEVADLCENLPAGHINNFPGAPYYKINLPHLYSNMDHGCVFKPSSVYGVCSSSCPVNSSIYNNAYITPGTKIYSPNGEHVFKFQLDGNIALYKIEPTKKWIMQWSSGTTGHTPISLAMQADGNLIGYFNNTVWTTNTYHVGIGPYCFTVQNNGNIAIFDNTCKATWARF